MKTMMKPVKLRLSAKLGQYCNALLLGSTTTYIREGHPGKIGYSSTKVIQEQVIVFLYSSRVNKCQVVKTIRHLLFIYLFNKCQVHTTLP
jgi:hypothetical protein